MFRAGTINLSVLRLAPVRRLLEAQWTSLSGDWAWVAALPFVVFSLGGGAGQVSLGFAVGAGSLVVLVLFGGVLADRYERRRMMIVADLMRMATQGSLAVLLLCGAGRYWQVLVAQVSIGSGTALAQPALSGLIAEIVPAEHLQSANALRGMLGSIAVLSGPALAGGALVAFGPGAAVALDAVSYALSALLLAGLRRRPPAERTEVGPFVAELRAGWAAFSGRTWLWVIVAEFALLNMLVFGPFEVLGASIAARSLGGAGAWSAILAATGAGQVVGGVAALAWHPARPLMSASLMVLGWAPLLVALGAGAPLAAILAAAVVTGIGWMVLIAIWESTMQERVPREQLSRISSYDWLGSTALMPIGFLLAAPVEATVGAGTGLIAAAGILVLATAGVVAVPSVRGMRARPPELDTAPPAPLAKARGSATASADDAKSAATR